ncbi:MAG: carboxypeptidase regulatory-like domain-containing protein, partial [Archangium sp.]|nr:carboxypeptidase regulatory-like domain-containing protein [Archangium sp.]
MSVSLSFRVLPALLATSLASCSLDLSVPETPKRGGLTGRVDTQGRVTVQGHEVQLVADDNTQSTQRTDAQGNFTFGDLAPGSYFLEVKVPGFAPYVRPSIRVLGGQQYDVGVLAPTWLQNSPQAATVLGKVVVEGGSGDTNGAQVEFVLEGVNQTVALAAVTSSGLFVQRVPPGTYTLRASHPLFVTQVSMGVVVAESENKDMSMQPMVLALNPATLTGKLLKEVDGQAAVAASGALVTFEGTGVTTTTDTTGQFQLAGLPAGTSAVRFSFAGFHDAVLSRPVRLEPGATTTVADVTLQLDRGDLVGEVRTSDGQPVTDATVSIPGTTYATQVVADPTDASRGNFSLRGLPTGAYSVRAAKARYIAAVSANTTVVANTATPLPSTLTLALQQGDFDIDDGDATNVAGYARTTSVTLKLNFANAATFRASEDPTFASSSFVPYTGGDQAFTLSSTQGTHVVYAQFEDAAGNRSATFSSTVVLDSVAPVSPAILINGGGGFTNQPNPLALTLTASDVPAPGVDTVSGLGAVRVTETAPVGGQLSSTARVYF